MQMAAEMFQEYRKQTEIWVRAYNHCKSRYPNVDFPKVARVIWRMGILAEAWGRIATALSNGQRDYIDDWRNGR